MQQVKYIATELDGLYVSSYCCICVLILLYMCPLIPLLLAYSR